MDLGSVMLVVSGCLLLGMLQVHATTDKDTLYTQPPSIKKIKQGNVYFVTEGKMDLNCVAGGNPIPVYHWLKDGVKLDLATEENKARMSMSSGVGSLVIIESKETDEGVYQCVAENTFGKSFSTKLNVQLARIDTFPAVQKPKTVRALLGRALVLDCSPPRSVPPANISWIVKSDFDLDPVILDDRITLDWYGNLYITNVKQTDGQNGNKFLCVATNRVNRALNLGSDTVVKPFGNPVDAPVSFMWHSEGQVLGLLKNTIKFKCIFAGNPQPSIVWRRRSGELNKSRMTQSEDKFEFEIKNVQYDDAGVYECEGSNSVSQNPESYQFMLTVESKPMWKQDEPKDIIAHPREDVTFSCAAKGIPQPTIKWYINGEPIEDAFYRRRIVTGTKLMITHLSKSDSQVIQCNATNRHGFIWADFYLHVHKKVEIVAAPLDLQLIHGNDATFTCGASTDSHETLEYIWLRDGKRIDENDPRVDMMNGTLTILDINSEDTADYTCIASNGLDNDTATAKLEVKAPPDPPTDVTLISCFAEGVRLKWKFPSDLENFVPLLNFIVEYNTTFTPEEWIVADLPSADTRGTLVKVSPWARYNFRVKAVNSIGESNPSKITTTCVTPMGRPERNPRMVKTVGNKTNYIIIEWEPMPQIEHNAPDLAYHITVKEINGDLALNFLEHDYRVGRKEIFVNNVYQPYEISVSARNKVGQAYVTPLTIVGFSGEGAPTVVPVNFELDPEKNMTATSAAFRWNPVDTSTEAMQGEFKGYKVRYWKVGQKATTMHEVLLPHSKNKRTQHGGKVIGEVHYLPSYSQIQADVVAVNNYFSSIGSNIVNFSTPEGVPSAVAYLEALYRGSTHFLLEWGEPKEPNGNVTGYKVGYRTIQVFDYGDLVIGDLIKERQTILEGLTPDQPYRVHVRGFTKKGFGEDFFIDVRTAKSTDELAKPTIVQAVAAGTFVNVSWLLPDVRGIRVGDRFVVEYRKTGDSQWTRGIGDKNGILWQQIEGLEQTTAFEVRVVYEAGQPGTVDYIETSSNIVEFETTIIELAKPTIVDVKASKSSINISWHLSETQGKQVGDRCFVEYRKTEDSEWKRVVVEGHEVLHHQLGGLKQATAYKVRVVYESGQPGTSNFRKTSSKIMGTKTKTADPDEADCPEDNLKETVCSLKDKVMKLEQELGMLKKSLKEERRERRRLKNLVHQVVVRQFQ